MFPFVFLFHFLSRRTHDSCSNWPTTVSSPLVFPGRKQPILRLLFQRQHSRRVPAAAAGRLPLRTAAAAAAATTTTTPTVPKPALHIAEPATLRPEWLVGGGGCGARGSRRGRLREPAVLGRRWRRRRQRQQRERRAAGLGFQGAFLYCLRSGGRQRRHLALRHAQRRDGATYGKPM